jgi:hypothetical protein
MKDEIERRGRGEEERIDGEEDAFASLIKEEG